MTERAKPRISILDPRFRYRDAANTDVALTFRRARMQQKQAQRKPDAAVVSLKQRAQGGGK